MDNFRLGFREVIPDQTLPEIWKEIVLNTGGTQSTLQDIKLPERAGGYFYKDASKHYTRNRFICWRVSQDTLEVVERSLEVRLSGARVRWRGGGPLLAASVHELPGRVLLLAASVCSVHRFVFLHPDVIHKQETESGRGQSQSLEDTSLSVLSEASSSQASDPKHFHIISHYASANSVPPHTCAMSVTSGGEALYALAGAGGSGGTGVLLVRLSPAGAAHTTLLRQESIVPRFLSALRGNRNEGDASCGLALAGGNGQNSVRLYSLGRDARLRAWCCERATCLATHSLLTDDADSYTQGAQSHMLRTGETSTGELLLGVFLCFATESHFTVFRPIQGEQGAVRFVRICHLFEPECDLVDFAVCGGGIWAAWGGELGGTTVTASTLGPAACWRKALQAPPPVPLLAPQSTHADYLECLFKPGLFPLAVIAKALSIYERSGENSILGNTTVRDQQSMLESSLLGAETSEGAVVSRSLRSRALSAAYAAEQRHASRAHLPPEDLMHKCWSELYSWCVQYLEGWRKPQGLVMSNHENGEWCILLRRGGVSFLRPMELLEHLFLSEDAFDLPPEDCCPAIAPELSVCRDVCTVVSAAGAVGRRLSEDVRSGIRAELSSGRTPDRLIPEVADRLLAHGVEGGPPAFPPAVIAALARKLSTVTDLPRAILALNQSLRLDCNDDVDDENDECSGMDTVFSSDMGVSLATEALYQMAEVRFSICCNLLVLGSILKGSSTHSSWPVAGHTGVSLQAYSALCWLCETTLGEADDHEALKSSIERLSLLRLDIGEELVSGIGSGRAAGVAWWIARGAGGRAARKLLDAPPLPPPTLHWSKLLQPYTHHLGHLMWGVSGGFTLGSWLAGAGRPKLVQSYTSLLAPWCEWNSCSREFIFGMSLLDTGDTQRALEAFLRAGRGANSEPFLANLLPQGPHTSRHTLLNYYLKVIKLFELHKSPECIISLAEKAIGIADKDDTHLPVFHSLLFRTWLGLEEWSRALAAACAHPSEEQRSNCLARLTAALGAQRRLGSLLAPPSTPPPPELIRQAELRARTADAPVNHYYSFLYAYHVRKGEMRKAADVMYEQANRVAAELGPGADSLGRRARCLLAALNSLSLVTPKHAFLVTPLSLSLTLNHADKRDSRGEIVPAEREVSVVRVEDLRKELHLVTARLKFANTQIDRLCPETGVEEVASLLSSVGLHAAAVSLRRRQGVPRAPALAALASAAAAIPTLQTGISTQDNQDADAWRWLAENDITELCSGDKSAAGAAWALLHSLVGNADDAATSTPSSESRASILHAVASRLLALGTFLPHWLLAEFKSLDVASLIRLLTRHGRLSEAAVVGSESLKMVSSLPRPSQPLCSPLPALDLLLAELKHQADLGDVFYVQLYEELDELVKLHCERIQRTSEFHRQTQVA